ncbi:hypothetical protein B566_EDAN004721 [Ephemera danica]|nr:hypothetical protein B566_EDAN004721 [Ephemera danica]
MYRGKSKYYCSVPLCTNTSLSAPQLLFFSLPRDETRRNLWYDACRRKDRYSLTTNSWVCEEHFNLTQARPRLKSTAIPITPSTSKSISLAEDSTGFCVVKNEPEDVEEVANSVTPNAFAFVKLEEAPSSYFFAENNREQESEASEQSGFFDNVSEKTIMTIKGFENLEPHLTKINAKLIRLPLVDEKDQLDLPHSLNQEEEEESDDQSFSREKNELIVKFYKQERDKAIRIHVEKGFGRLRQFAFLAPHTIIPQQLQDCVDDAMKIACGLVNTYTPLEKL